MSDPITISAVGAGEIDASPDAFARYLAADEDGPVTILTLVRFADGGRATYQEYLEQVSVLMAEVGADILYAGEFSSPLIPGDPSGWDGLVLGRYRDRAGLVKISRDPRFGAINQLRQDALSAIFVQALVSW